MKNTVALSSSSLHTELQLALRSRDELLWTEFIRRSQPVIAGVVIKAVRRWGRPTPSLIDDLVQETYLKLFAHNARALRRFVCHHESALFGFLKVVASNIVQDHFRCSFSRKRGGGQADESIEDSATGHTTPRTFGDEYCASPLSAGIPRHKGDHKGIEGRILLGEIDAYLRSRGSEPALARDYIIFRLYYREGLTARAISRVPFIALTVKGVESTLLRITRLVRKRMERRPSIPLAVPSRIITRRIQLEE